jgi:hypothetical protein
VGNFQVTGYMGIKLKNLGLIGLGMVAGIAV